MTASLERTGYRPGAASGGVTHGMCGTLIDNEGDGVMANWIQQRLLDLGTEIATTPPEELAFQHSILAQTCLPASKPPDGLLVWERQQGRARLRVHPTHAPPRLQGPPVADAPQQ
jgi:hypothetical protein